MRIRPDLSRDDADTLEDFLSFRQPPGVSKEQH